MFVAVVNQLMPNGEALVCEISKWNFTDKTGKRKKTREQPRTKAAWATAKKVKYFNKWRKQLYF